MGLKTGAGVAAPKLNWKIKYLLKVKDFHEIRRCFDIIYGLHFFSAIAI